MHVRTILMSCLLAGALAESSPLPPLPPLPIDALARTVWVEEFDISRDGELIAFKSAKAGTYDIWTVPTSGGAPTQLTRMPGREMNPHFSPDGSYIVFEADFGGTNVRDLYLVPSSGGEPQRLTDHPLDDREPSWSPDGALYFTTQMFWDRSLAVMDVSTREIEARRSWRRHRVAGRKDGGLHREPKAGGRRSEQSRYLRDAG